MCLYLKKKFVLFLQYLITSDSNPTIQPWLSPFYDKLLRALGLEEDLRGVRGTGDHDLDILGLLGQRLGEVGWFNYNIIGAPGNRKGIQCTTVIIQSFRTNRSGQTVQTRIRLLLEKQSDQGLHCLLFHLHLFDEIP